MTTRASEALAAPPDAELVRIDARGLKCPWPVLRAARAMREHGAIALLADDPVARDDIPALADARGWRLEMREMERVTLYLLHAGATNSAR